MLRFVDAHEWMNEDYGDVDDITTSSKWRRWVGIIDLLIEW